MLFLLEKNNLNRKFIFFFSYKAIFLKLLNNNEKITKNYLVIDNKNCFIVLNNYKIFFRGFMKKWINKSSLKKVSHEFHLVTIESAFVVRTFFFGLFGITITLQSLFNVKVAIISGLILLGLYIIRFIVLKVFVQKDILPQLFLAPRGLITILLFFAIPDEYQVENFDSGILLYTIIISCIIMAVSLVASGKKVEPVEDMSFIYGPKSMNEVETMPIVEQNSEDKDDLISEK